MMGNEFLTADFWAERVLRVSQGIWPAKPGEMGSWEVFCAKASKRDWTRFLTTLSCLTPEKDPERYIMQYRRLISSHQADGGPWMQKNSDLSSEKKLEEIAGMGWKASAELVKKLREGTGMASGAGQLYETQKRISDALALSSSTWLLGAEPVCECGAEKCRTTHSTWCPKFGKRGDGR